MAKPGYLYWDTRILRLGMYVAGRRIKGGLVHPNRADYSRSAPGVLLSTLGHSDVLQVRWFGGDVPVSLEPISVRFSMILSDQADADAITEAQSAGAPVDLWLDLVIADQWSIPHAAAGQTQWKTSRKLPYGLDFVTVANRPPRVFIDDTEQTVIHAGVPAAGEVVVPDAGGYAVITTPAGIVGTMLKLRYHPIIVARVTQADYGHEDVNHLNLQVEIEEIRSRLFSVAAA